VFAGRRRQLVVVVGKLTNANSNQLIAERIRVVD
jgi:hypothetical protein